MSIFSLLADFVVLIHFLFVLFVIFGGILAIRFPRIAFVHIPMALWGAIIEFTGWFCPLTPLEIFFREKAGGSGYPGGFIEHYIMPILYPARLTPEIQVGLGILVITLNICIYWQVYRLRKRRSLRTPHSPHG